MVSPNRSIPPDQAHKLMLIIDALYESAKTGAPVAV